jgi:hypothetical protein
LKLGVALTEVPTAELRKLLAALHKGTLRAPITHPELLKAGLPGLVDRVGFLQGLSDEASRAVLVAVLSERAAAERRARG